MVPSTEDGVIKAELIAMGRVSVGRDLLAGYRLSHSTAGPGAGSTSLALGWDGADGLEHRVKLAVAPEGDPSAPVSLVLTDGGGLELRRADGTLLVAGVRLLPIVMHAPGQAFINLSGECRYECAFCTTPLLGPGRRKEVGPARWVELVAEAHASEPFEAMAITSVASPDHEGMMRAYEEVIRGVLARLPDLVVGVEPYVEGIQDIQRLRDAGATEIKINVQCPTQDLLERVCPGWSLDRQHRLLREAVGVFGRGKVTSNVLIGLGETDEQVSSEVERLAAMGVVPSVRVVRVNAMNRSAIERALGRPVDPVGPGRHLRLARVLHQALERHGLSAGALGSMCHRCGCCDLEPGVDV